MSLDVRPLSARSVLLSLLLGSHPARLSTAELVRVAEVHGVSAATTRVALTRLVASGDVVREDSTHALSTRLLARQARQDEGLDPTIVPWLGDWEVVVVTALGRSAETRAALRAELTSMRLAELREGVWTRPANLVRASAPDSTTRFVGSTDEPALADRLWDLSSWSSTGHDLLDALDSAADPARRIAVAAAVVRHLLTDPVLPPELLPNDWPGGELRAAYRDYSAAVSAERQDANGLRGKLRDRQNSSVGNARKS